MTTAIEDPAGAPPVRPDDRRSSWPTRLAIFAIVAVTVSPIVVAALSLIGDAWYPVGDLSHIYFRVGQVGTRSTPLVGAETIKGWAHPGPAEFWLAAPLYRLTGEDARSLMWTAATINVVAVAGIAAVAWRRGGFPLLLGLMAMVGVLIHTLGPERVTSIWNPFLPLLPFLLTIVLAWDVALGNRRALLWLGVAATVAAQTHFAFLTLCGLVGVWLVAWALWWRKLVPDEPDEPDVERGVGTGSGPEPLASVAPPRPPWGPWRRALVRAAVVVGLLWLPVAFDALFDLHNPINIAKSVVKSPPSVGPIDALGIVGRYMRPDGPWVGGAEPVSVFSVQGSGPFPLLLALVVLACCLWVAARRRLVDVVALATLSLALVVGSVPATSQIFLPVYSYLTQFLKLVGALVWFTVLWTLWRALGPALADRRAGRAVLAGALGVVLVATAAWTCGNATSLPTPNPAEEQAVQAIRRQLDGVLPRGETLRVEHFGDYLNIPGPGIVYWLIHDGFDVLTSDGAHGLKWGHAHRWQKGEDSDRVITVAMYYEGSFFDPIKQCRDKADSEEIAHYDPLTAEERQWLDDLRLAAVGGGPKPSATDQARAEELGEKGPMISVFEGDRPCARKPKDL